MPAADRLQAHLVGLHHRHRIFTTSIYLIGVGADQRAWAGAVM
jgi:hypothetical protein